MADVEARVRAGESLRFMCWCTPKRCHADSIVKALRNRLLRDRVEVSVGGAASTPAPQQAPADADASDPASTGRASGSGGRGGGRGRGRIRGRGRVSRLQHY
eukprot:1044415-Prymnesium_polylepis.1